MVLSRHLEGRTWERHETAIRKADLCFDI